MGAVEVDRVLVAAAPDRDVGDPAGQVTLDRDVRDGWEVKRWSRFENNRR
jgi:hypothetical protein